MNYMTIIFDIKESRKLPNREAVQYLLIDTIKAANTQFSHYLASPFLITLGDEWQGLLYYPCDYNSIINFFNEKLDKINFYCGIGVGSIAIHNFELTVNQLDGPSFYKARTALKIAKKYSYSVVFIE